MSDPGEGSSAPAQKRLLVVEDNDNDFNLFSLLYSDRYDIVRARTMEESLKILSEQGKEAFSAIVLDLMLPDGGTPQNVIKNMEQYSDKIAILSNSEDPSAWQSAENEKIPFFSKTEAYSPYCTNDKVSFLSALDSVDRIKDSDRWQTDAIHEQIEVLSRLRRETSEDKVEYLRRISTLEKDLSILLEKLDMALERISRIESDIDDNKRRIDRIEEKNKVLYAWIGILHRLAKLPKWFWVGVVGTLSILISEDISELVKDLLELLVK